MEKGFWELILNFNLPKLDQRVFEAPETGLQIKVANRASRDQLNTSRSLGMTHRLSVQKLQCFPNQFVRCL